MRHVPIAVSYGTDVSSRRRAAELREQILRTVDQRGGTFEIDFRNVRTASDSFADELFGVLVAERGHEWFREHISVVNLPPMIRQTILQAILDRTEPVETAP